MGPVTAALRPQSDRGGVLAAGAVLLTTAVVMIDLRMGAQWADGVQLIVALAAFVPIFGSALLGTPDVDGPHAYQSVLIVAGLTLLVLVLGHLAEVLGSDQPQSSSGALMWTSAVFAATAGYAAVRLGSSIATLAAVLAAGLAFEAFVDDASDPKGPSTFRWVALFLVAVYAVGAGALSERNRRHSVQFVNAAAVWTIVLAFTFIVGVIVSAFTGGGSESAKGAAWGWEVALFASSLGVIGYATLARERGPAYLGFLALLTTAVLVGLPEHVGEGSVVGWPLVFLLAGAAGIVFALRPNGGPPATAVLPTTEPPPAATAPPPEGMPPPAP